MSTVAPESPVLVQSGANYEPPRRASLPPAVVLAKLFGMFDRCDRTQGLTLDACEDLSAHLPCHVILGADGSEYLRRYGVADFANGGHVWLHKVCRSDMDRGLHSHPWPARALVLVSGYSEERRVVDTTSPTGYGVGVINYRPGDTNEIEADTFHRIDLIDGRPAWTILITGPKAIRPEGEASWSFWDRVTGIATGYRAFLAAKGLAAVSTPQDLARGMVPTAR